MPKYTLLLILFVLSLCCSPIAAGFERPIPQPRSEAVELWFALASLMLCIALYAVHRLVKRR